MTEFYPFIYESPKSKDLEYQYLYIDDYYSDPIIEEPEIKIIIIDIL